MIMKDEGNFFKGVPNFGHYAEKIHIFVSLQKMPQLFNKILGRFIDCNERSRK